MLTLRRVSVSAKKIQNVSFLIKNTHRELNVALPQKPEESDRTLNLVTARSTHKTSKSTDGQVLHPRQIKVHLDSYVISQEQAKTTLSVAVYNHYLRHKYLQGIAKLNLARSKKAECEQKQEESNEPQDFEAPTANKSSILTPGSPTAYKYSELISESLFDTDLSTKSTISSETDSAPITDPTNQVQAPEKKEKDISAIQKILDELKEELHLSPEDLDDAPLIEKSNILILGPTGTGKTLLVRTLAKLLGVPYVVVEATRLTMAGYIGENVEDMIYRLLSAADNDLERAMKGIIFIDEVDKLAKSPSADRSKDITGEGVQQALLNLIEGTNIEVELDPNEGKRENVDTSNILFVLSGAFVGIENIIRKRLGKGERSIGFQTTNSEEKNEDILDHVQAADLIKFGLIPEFLGRIPTVTRTKSLSKDELLQVLTRPKNALLKQYVWQFKLSGVELMFTTGAKECIVERVLGGTKPDGRGGVAGLGARGLRRAMERVLAECMFAAPESGIKHILITRRVVLGLEKPHYYSRGQKHVFSSDFDQAEGDEMRVKAGGEENKETGVKEGKGERVKVPEKVKEAGMGIP